jgi:hypothetical protein
VGFGIPKNRGGCIAGLILEALEESRVPNLHDLAMETGAAGTYDLLPYPSLVFSSTVTEHGCSVSQVRATHE